MKFGAMKYDVPYEKLGPGNLDFGFFTKLAIIKEGKQLYRLHPEYKYLDEDPWLKREGDFYESVVYAYMVDQILKNNPNIISRYKSLNDGGFDYSGKIAYLFLNDTFLRWYKDYLREQADHGVLAREKAERDKELKDSISRHAAFARMDEERHPHVTCPYCHSANTEKISTLNRAVSISIVGAASSKLGKQWHCNNCKSDF